VLAEKTACFKQVQPLCGAKAAGEVYMIAPQYGDNFQGKCGACGAYASAFTTISLPERVVYVPQLGQAV
jgi:glycine/serine hydroxymethyltransferase